MKVLKFSKMHGLGNDFMVVDNIDGSLQFDAREISVLSNRKIGVGFDQFLLIEAPDNADVDFNYRIFNADGNEVEHCGNGARCFAKYIKDKGLSDKQTLAVKVKKGIINVTYHDDNHIEVDMGQPILTPSQVPFNFQPDTYQSQYNLVFGETTLPASVLSMGNPHVVFYVSNLWDLSLVELGSALQKSDYFPDSVNVNFVEVIDENHLEIRTYERGVGETNACGTGACAAAFATYQLGVGQPQVAVKARGGQLLIRIDEQQRIVMSGPARWVFDGVISL